GSLGPSPRWGRDRKAPRGRLRPDSPRGVPSREDACECRSDRRSRRSLRARLGGVRPVFFSVSCRSSASTSRGAYGRNISLSRIMQRNATQSRFYSSHNATQNDRSPHSPYRVGASLGGSDMNPSKLSPASLVLILLASSVAQAGSLSPKERGLRLI